MLAYGFKTELLVRRSAAMREIVRPGEAQPSASASTIRALPLVPAKARIQYLALDSLFRRPIWCAKVGVIAATTTQAALAAKAATNLRFKTDVSKNGPEKGGPTLVPAGMMRHRADPIFSPPDEISGFISLRC